MHKRNSLLWLATCVVLTSLGGCGTAEPPVIESLVVAIDAHNNCAMADQPVECSGVAAAIRTRYPTSRPRVDICLDKQSRYEAAVEVMNSVSEAGFTVGNFACESSPAGT